MTRILFTIVFITTLTVASGQVLEKFEFSDCMTECFGDRTSIDKVLQTNDLTEISLTAYANCSGNLEGKIQFTNDTLVLIYSPKIQRTVNEKTGEAEEFFEVALCDCVFKLNYTISGLQTIDKNRLKINGETLDEINKRNLVHIEPIEVVSDMDTTSFSERVFKVVENSAQFPGGFEKLKEYIERNLVYPKNAEKKGISGKVFVEFVINKDGSIDDTTIKVLQGLNKSCNNEAIRLVNECPNWIPGTVMGQAVKQEYVLPITFKAIKRQRY